MAPDLPDPRDPKAVADSLKPEVSEGPFGIPYVKPKGAPNFGSKY